MISGLLDPLDQYPSLLPCYAALLVYVRGGVYLHSLVEFQQSAYKLLGTLLGFVAVGVSLETIL